MVWCAFSKKLFTAEWHEKFESDAYFKYKGNMIFGDLYVHILALPEGSKEPGSIDVNQYIFYLSLIQPTTIRMFENKFENQMSI